MILNGLLYPLRMVFSAYFNDEQLSSFLIGALTVGIMWLLTALQDCVPDKFTRDWNFQNDDEFSESDEKDDDFSFVDPWNAPFSYVSTQQRRMVRSSISTMVDLHKHIGELPKRFKRKHWPWETIRRKVLGEESENNDDDNDFISTNSKVDDSNTSGTILVVKKEENSAAAHSAGDSTTNDHTNEDEHANDNTTESAGSLHDGVANKDEKKLCIGSIFGLDVGGTLAKLIYFEKKSSDLDSFATRNLRKKQYVQAVSAKTVLMARMHSNINEGFAAKRSTSMSPMRTSPSPMLSEPNRVRNNISDECEFHDDQQVQIQNMIPSVIKLPSNMPKRRTLSMEHACAVQNKEDLRHPSELEYHVCEQDDKEPETLPQHESLKHKTSKDLKDLYAMRQDSLPEDILRQSLDLPTISSLITDVRRNHEVFGPISKREDTGDISDTFDDNENNSCSKSAEISLSTSALPAINNTKLREKRSISMLDLSTQHDRQKTEALNRFYDFARRLDTNEDSISDIQLSFYCRELGGDFHFISFETRKMKNAMDLIRLNNLHLNIRNMGATGGGAHKFADIWEEDLGIGMIKQDELDSLVAGMQFVLSTVVGECFTFRPRDDEKVEQQILTERKIDTENPRSESLTDDCKPYPEPSLGKSQKSSENKAKLYKLDRWIRKVQRDTISYSSAYPYMLVTIGTGVSVLRVDGPRKHERVSGSTIGGGTFWGLMRLLTDVENFEEAMKLAEKGDPTKVDMMVGDIYGEDSDALEKLGLSADIVASSFGKLVSKEDPAKGLTQEDLARALLSLVTNNIGQVAYLNAKLHNTPRIYFVGSFLRHNMISQRRLSYAIDYWSKGEMEALFLEHEGYFGALGAFLMTQHIEKDGGFFQWNHDT